MGVGDFIDKKILELVENKLVGTGISLEQFVEEAMLTKLAAPSHRTLKVETLIRIWDTAVKHGQVEGFKEKFFHFHFGIKIHKSDDPHPWDEIHPYAGPNPRLEEDRVFLREIIDLRKPAPKKTERSPEVDWFLE